MTESDDIFGHLKQTSQDFGKFIRRVVENNNYSFNSPIVIEYFTKIDHDCFMAFSSYPFNGEEFELNLIFSQDQLNQLAINLQILDLDFGRHFLNILNEPIKLYEEIDFGNRESISLLLTGQLALDMEDDLKTMGDEFLPFRVIEVQGCSIIDY